MPSRAVVGTVPFQLAAERVRTCRCRAEGQRWTRGSGKNQHVVHDDVNRLPVLVAAVVGLKLVVLCAGLNVWPQVRLGCVCGCVRWRLGGRCESGTRCTVRLRPIYACWVFECDRCKNIQFSGAYCETGVPGGLLGGPRAYQYQFAGSSPTECMLARAFSSTKEID